MNPPAIGARVMVTINGIGLSEVRGYFVEHGFLGLRVRPCNPPEWYVKQNGKRHIGHVFGAEIEIIPEHVASVIRDLRDALDACFARLPDKDAARLGDKVDSAVQRADKIVGPPVE